MSNKMLHERLREAKFGDCLCGTINLTGKRCDDFADCASCLRTLNDAIADEIERYYIPRPRFEDGEPVQFGDEPEWLVTVDEMTFYENGIVCVGHDGNTFAVNPGELVKRPTPKVLDADGVPIKVGDTVYEVETGLRSTVTSTTMLDSNGNTVCCKDGCPGELHYKPEELTHQEPDSLEKLMGDIKDYGAEVHIDECWAATTDEWARRLARLIERMEPGRRVLPDARIEEER